MHVCSGLDVRLGSMFLDPAADAPQGELAALSCLKALLAEVALRTSATTTVVGLGIPSRDEEIPMPRRNRQLPTVQLDLFRWSSPYSLDWPRLSAEVREKVTRLIAQMLSRHELGNLFSHSDGDHDDE